VAQGHIDTVVALLKSLTVAASGDAVNVAGYTALMIAAQHGHAEIIEALLACPAVVASACAVNAEGNTALVLASTFNHAEAVKRYFYVLRWLQQFREDWGGKEDAMRRAPE
jgi:ankyrin repeat protein